MRKRQQLVWMGPGAILFYGPFLTLRCRHANTYCQGACSLCKGIPGVTSRLLKVPWLRLCIDCHSREECGCNQLRSLTAAQLTILTSSVHCSELWCFSRLVLLTKPVTRSSYLLCGLEDGNWIRSTSILLSEKHKNGYFTVQSYRKLLSISKSVWGRHCLIFVQVI